MCQIGRLHEMMRRYDLERVGSINLEAFEHALSPFLSLSAQDIRALFQDCDVRSSGKVDIEMFCSLADYWRKSATALPEQGNGKTSSPHVSSNGPGMEWSSELTDALEVVCKRRRDAFMQACLQLSGGGDTVQPLLLKELLMAVRYAGVPTSAGLVKELEQFAAHCGAHTSSGHIDPLVLLQAADATLADAAFQQHSLANPARDQPRSSNPQVESSGANSGAAGDEAQSALVGVGAGFWRRAGQYLQTNSLLGDPSLQLITLDNCAEAFARAGLKLSRRDALAMWRAIHAQVSKTPGSEPGNIAIPFRDLERIFRDKLVPSPAAFPIESAPLSLRAPMPMPMRMQRHGPHVVDPAATCPWAVGDSQNDGRLHSRAMATHAPSLQVPSTPMPPHKPAAGARIAHRSDTATPSAVPAARAAPYAVGSSFETELQHTQPQPHSLALPSDSPRQISTGDTSRSNYHGSLNNANNFDGGFGVNNHQYATREARHPVAPAPPPVPPLPPPEATPTPTPWPVPELDAPAGLQMLLRRTRMVPSETLEAIFPEGSRHGGGPSGSVALGRGDVARMLARCGVVVRDAEIEALLFFANKTFGVHTLSMPALRYLLGLPVSAAGWARLEQDRNVNFGFFNSDPNVSHNSHDEYTHAVSARE